jgi:hypothetical protein
MKEASLPAGGWEGEHAAVAPTSCRTHAESDAVSTMSFVRSSISINRWLSSLPSVDAVRPARCPDCGAASRPVGEALQLWGHGCVRRHVRGWVSDNRPTPEHGETEVVLRRYRCVQAGCGSVILVGPSEWAPRRRYLRTAIALALYLWSTLGQAQGDAYAVVTGLGETRLDRPERWRTLRLWARAACQGVLFQGVPRFAATVFSRATVRGLVNALVGASPPSTRGEPERARVLAGAAHAM